MRRAIPVIVGIFSATILGAVLLGLFGGLLSTPNSSDKNEPRANLVYKSPFNGVIPEEPLLPRPPFAVMIENEKLARPWQKGLSSADVVYEALAEGGITRFLAVFLEQKYEGKMGPVRSARTYFLDWAHEWKGLYVHVGGRYDALARLRRENLYDVDQFIFDSFFRRENVGRTAYEHTVFTSGKLLSLFLSTRSRPVEIGKKLSTMSTAPMMKLLNSSMGAPAPTIRIDFGFPTYLIEYIFDEKSGSWLRSQAGAPHEDNENGARIAPKTVVIQHVKSWSNGDAAGSITIQTIGKGTAKIYRSGRMTEGKWEKKSLEEPTRFFDSGGREITNMEMPIWIEVVPL